MGAAERHELEKAKDRKRRQGYRERRRIERESLQQEVEKLTKELRNASGRKNLLASAWEMLAKRQLAARMAAEAEQRRLFKAVSSRAVLLEEFQDLMNQRVAKWCDFSSSEYVDTRTASYQHKRIRLEPMDDAIFSAYIQELGGVFTQTDEALRLRGLDATEPNWDEPSETWIKDPDTGYFLYGGKLTLPFDFRKLCMSRWYTAPLWHRQESRQLYKGLDDPDNTHELEKAKDRKRRREYREQRRTERHNLQQEIIRLTEELEKIQGAAKTLSTLSTSSWKMIAQRQLAARKGAENQQTQLHKAIDMYATVIKEFHCLFHERLQHLNVVSIYQELSIKNEPASAFSQHKKIRFDSTDTDIFATYIKELDAVYAQTDKTLQTWCLESTEPNWDAPKEIWDKDPDTGYFQFRGKGRSTLRISADRDGKLHTCSIYKIAERFMMQSTIPRTHWHSSFAVRLA
ncbi:hypothetical protein AM588_10004723 [Phytophthora nicotianae]|uniref:Uncharacterized protein n=1 Tax=Phytophthora nicotianae TaxID=4792 RepID=A0A0W8D2T2_PHYNI|nr:hypothetical protein AM588_10004723 [Phytophthora nicotianae]